jgi:hypothetical protein
VRTLTRPAARHRLAVPGSLVASVLDLADADLPLWFEPSESLALWCVDVWERDVSAVARMAANVDLLLLAYGDAVAMVRAAVPASLAARVHLFPLFVDTEAFAARETARDLPLVQVGRQDPELHEWALRYSSERDLRYVYQHRGEWGLWYLDGRPWELPGVQLGYDSLLRLLGSARIALVSPPDRTDPLRTGGVSPLTPRYLEAAMCGAILVGRAPRGCEYRNFPSDFTLEPADYADFRRICDELLRDDEGRRERAELNRAHVLAEHGASARARLLVELLGGRHAAHAGGR